jgi:hypothetical protein
MHSQWGSRGNGVDPASDTNDHALTRHNIMGLGRTAGKAAGQGHGIQLGF